MKRAPKTEQRPRRSARARKNVEMLSYEATMTSLGCKRRRKGHTNSEVVSRPCRVSPCVISPSPSAKKSRSDSESLGQLALSFKQKILASKDNMYLIKKDDDSLGGSNRRIYDVLNVLEGIGMVERHPRTPHVRWVGPLDSKTEVMEQRQANILMKNEATQIEDWMSSLREVSSSRRASGMLYCNQSHFRVIDESQTSLILSAESKVAVKVQSNETKPNQSASVRVRVPENTPPPKTYLMESPSDPLKPLNLTTPPLLAQCASDFTWTQLPNFDSAANDAIDVQEDVSNFPAKTRYMDPIFP